MNSRMISNTASICGVLAAAGAVPAIASRQKDIPYAKHLELRGHLHRFLTRDIESERMLHLDSASLTSGLDDVRPAPLVRDATARHCEGSR